jgi:hypothetical protein
MNLPGSLEFRAKPNCGGQFNNRGFILDGFRSLNSLLNGFEIIVAIFNVLRVPSTS